MSNIAHVGLGAKMGFKIWNFELKGLELSFLHHSIRLEKCNIFVPKNFKIEKKLTELCPCKVWAQKWQLAYFWPIIGIFGHNFEHMDFIFVLPII